MHGRRRCAATRAASDRPVRRRPGSPIALGARASTPAARRRPRGSSGSRSPPTTSAGTPSGPRRSRPSPHHVEHRARGVSSVESVRHLAEDAGARVPPRGGGIARPSSSARDGVPAPRQGAGRGALPGSRGAIRTTAAAAPVRAASRATTRARPVSDQHGRLRQPRACGDHAPRRVPRDRRRPRSSSSCHSQPRWPEEARRPAARRRPVPRARAGRAATRRSARSRREPGSPAASASASTTKKALGATSRPRASFGAPEGPLSPETGLGLRKPTCLA